MKTKLIRIGNSRGVRIPKPLFKQFMDNESFKRWMTDTVFGLTYEAAGVAPTTEA